MDILEQFGINGKLLVVQLINFTLLVVVIWKVVLPRLTKLMDDRKRSIEESLKAAEEARKEVEDSKAAREALLKKADVEAAALIKSAKDQADRTRTELLNAAKQDADSLRARTEEQLVAEREKLREELRAEVAALTIETTRKVLSDVVRPTDQKKMVASAAKYLKKQAASANRPSPRLRNGSASAGRGESRGK